MRDVYMSMFNIYWCRQVILELSSIQSNSALLASDISECVFVWRSSAPTQRTGRGCSVITNYTKSMCLVLDSLARCDVLLAPLNRGILLSCVFFYTKQHCAWKIKTPWNQDFIVKIFKSEWNLRKCQNLSKKQQRKHAEIMFTVFTISV